MKDEIVVSERSNIDDVFIIAKGEFKLTKKIDKNEKGQFNSIDDQLINNQIHLVHGQVVPISILSNGHLFGEECLFDNISLFQYSVQCSSAKGTIYSIPISAFSILEGSSLDHLKAFYFSGKKDFQTSIFRDVVNALVSKQMNFNRRVEFSPDKDAEPEKNRFHRKGLLPYLKNCNEIFKNLEKLKKKRTLKPQNTKNNLESINELLSNKPLSKKFQTILFQSQKNSVVYLNNLNSFVGCSKKVKNENQQSKDLLIINKMSSKSFALMKN